MAPTYPFTFFSYGYGADDSTTAASYSWDDSNTSSIGTVYYSFCSYPVYGVVNSESDTEEQKQARLTREEEYRKQQEQLRKDNEAAIVKAEELLREHLGEQRYEKLQKQGYIELDSQKHVGCKYRVPKAHRDMIEVVDRYDKVIDTLCVHPAIDCPSGDQTLTRIKYLELAEEFILAKSNRHGPREVSRLARV